MIVYFSEEVAIFSFACIHLVLIDQKNGVDILSVDVVSSDI
jgi:hypothetical protein